MASTEGVLAIGRPPGLYAYISGDPVGAPYQDQDQDTEVRYDPLRMARSDYARTAITPEAAVAAVQAGLAAGSRQHGVEVYPGSRAPREFSSDAKMHARDHFWKLSGAVSRISMPADLWKFCVCTSSDPNPRKSISAVLQESTVRNSRFARYSLLCAMRGQPASCDRVADLAA